MIKVAVSVGIIVLVAVLGWMSLRQDNGIIVSEATISRMMDGSIMAGAVLTNTGEPEVLIGATVNGFQHVHIMGAGGALVVPGGTAPVLAGDGAHIMMSGPSDLAIGGLVPLVLTFQDGSEVTARAQIVEPAMDHMAMSGIETEELSIDIRLDSPAGPEGVAGVVDITGLDLVSRPDGTDHVDGEGHAHLYLNGLKLQRLYEPNFQIGTLLPGDYILRATLNANDHRPYVLDGKPIFAEVKFAVE